MFPVGLVTKLGVSTPIVRAGRVIGFYDGWIANRKFPVDMAGFAINVKVFLDHPQAFMPFVVGYEEDGLLKNLKINVADIEPKAENCTKVRFPEGCFLGLVFLWSLPRVGRFWLVEVMSFRAARKFLLYWYYWVLTDVNDLDVCSLLIAINCRHRSCLCHAIGW
ncbi:UNVERIFIED_CONTAM: hypothetical protein GTU68_009319 [Idotea baltica]|nr:hypothetical protein [Idotea baltica]